MRPFSKHIYRIGIKTLSEKRKEKFNEILPMLFDESGNIIHENNGQTTISLSDKVYKGIYYYELYYVRFFYFRDDSLLQFFVD